MPATTDARVVEHGLAGSWSRQARWSEGGSVHRLGGLLVALSGVRDQTQQVAVVDGDLADAEAALVAAEVLFDRAGWNPAVDLLAGEHPELEQVLVERGFHLVVERPAMVLRHDDPVPVLDPPIEVRRATLADRSAVVAVQSEAFGVARRIAGAMVPPAAFDDPGLELLVAVTPRGRVVGSVAVHVDGEVGGIVGAGVVDRFRRRGAGTALTVAALESASRRGAESVWLQATPSGRPVYERCGFREVGPCQVWLRSHAR